MEAKPKQGGHKWLRGIRNAAILLAVFSVGLNIGNGNIDLSRTKSENGSLPATLDYSQVDDVYQSLKENYHGKLTQQQLHDGLKHGLATATNDPYTVYFTPKEAREFEEQINNHFSGVGAQLGQDKDGNIEIIAPIEGMPAEKAGLKAKDIIATINDKSTSGMSVDEAVSKIRGPKGTTVKLELIRNRSETLEISIVRDNIKIPSVEAETLEGNIGMIQINDFADDTSTLARQAALDFKQKGVKSIILDLRNNGGGYLDAAEDIASLWLPANAKILEQKGTTGNETSHASGNDILKGIPTVVLINRGSASASEIVAGALHDNKAGYLIGEKSYGKGVVQSLINFRDGAQLKVTTASWYRPNGQNINKQGIKPDKEVKLTDEDSEADRDPQLDAAKAYLTTPR